MSLRKYQSVEETEVLPPEEHEQISAELSKTGKHSITELSDEERQSLTVLTDTLNR